MKISATYANRSDLSSFQKKRFTLEKKIRQNKSVRVSYKFLFFSNPWVKDTVEFLLFLSILIPLFLMIVLEELLKKVFGEEIGEYLTFPVYVAALCVLIYFYFLAWILVALTTIFLTALWFFGLMIPYDDLLQQEKLFYET